MATRLCPQGLAPPQCGRWQRRPQRSQFCGTRRVTGRGQQQQLLLSLVYAQALPPVLPVDKRDIYAAVGSKLDS